MDTSVSPPSPVSATQATDLLLVDASGDAAGYAAVLRSSYRVATTADRSEALLAGTNRVWPNTHRPYCNHGGVTRFEFCSHRRAWFACLECKKVWIAKRLE
jgi:hypothetical protein